MVMENLRALPEHEWLHQLVGEWVVDWGEAEGRETVSAIGENWVSGRSEGPGPGPDGSVMVSQVTVGFDPDQGKFVGSWVGSMMNHQWVYEGYLEGDRLILESEGPRFDGEPGLGKYRDVVVFDGPDVRRLIGEHLTDAGEWVQFMETTYRRV
ncbi:hypothetical protein C0431_09020 [bacterium]|nr:hypothetical protein [bacterium]